MEIKKVLAHTCFKRKKGDGYLAALSPKKCSCRRYITVAKAEEEVRIGAAQYVVIGYKEVETEATCPICFNTSLKKICDSCEHTGLIKTKKPEPIYGQDVIRTVGPDGRNILTTKVKKAPTIEAGHILRAYVNARRESQLRIEEYGRLSKELISSLISGFEPADDLKTGTGRRYDYGRPI